MAQNVKLCDLVAVMEGLYPPATAQQWDAVGLVVGDPEAAVQKVLFAVDPVADVVQEAIDWGADAVVTHHPLFLKAVNSVAATSFKGSVVHQLIRHNIALYVAHTNADAASNGVADALADLLGLVDRQPLVVHQGPGAPDAQPGGHAGGPGTQADGASAGSGQQAIGIGRVGQLAEPVPLESLARLLSRVLPATAQGVRVAGDLQATVHRVAVVGGSGDSLFDAVRAAQADVYITADLRHHPASELREQAHFEASRLAAGAVSRPYLLDVAHFASEWPWLRHAARDLNQQLEAQGHSPVTTRVSTIITDPWTAVVGNMAAQIN